MEPPFSLAVVVDDDPDIALAARLALRDMFERVETLRSPAELLPLLKRESPDAILLDLNFERGATNGREGLDFLGRIMEQEPDAAVVIITAHGAVSVAVEALKAGASDFVAKPWSNERLAATVRSAAALRRSRIDARTERGRASELAPSTDTPLLGKSRGYGARADADRPRRADRCQRSDPRRKRHRQGDCRPRDPSIVAALDPSDGVGRPWRDRGNPVRIRAVRSRQRLFTGAEGDRIGRLKAADKSTLFLDEIGNLPLHLQPKLLTALEQREVVPVGANKPIPIDVRVVAATNASADALADEKRFRQDLLFRLNTIEIELPPLRERREDVPVLLDHYLSLYARKYDKPQRELPTHVLDVLVRHDWPGNVRALRHAAERAVIMADGDRYHIDDFPLPLRSQAASLAVVGDSLNLDQLEKQMIERALRLHHFNVSLAASELGLSRGALYRRMEKHGL